MLLVDGDHGYRGALQDIRNMRALAKPGAVLLVDDLDEGPGPALRQAQAEGLVEILERRMFNASTVGDEVNPCIRRVRAPMWNCKNTWGWAAARYLDAKVPPYPLSPPTPAGKLWSPAIVDPAQSS